MKNFLAVIFIIAVALRFIYFPDNVYFGYDQARDAYTSQEIIAGDIIIKGPSASFDSNIFHGALSYYILAPLYYISGGDPTLFSVVLRLYNALGVILVFLIAALLFNRKTALIAATLYAVSYEQTQYALFLSHPSFAVLTVLLFYYGCVKYFFQNNLKGLVLSAFGLGLSIQFHFSLIILAFVFLAMFILFKVPWNLISTANAKFFSLVKSRLPDYFKYVAISIICFLLTTATFIISEYKYGDFWKILTSSNQNSLINANNTIESAIFHITTITRDNLIAIPGNPAVILALALLFIAAIIYRNNHKKQLVFLLIWIIGGIVPYLLSYSKIYYYGIGGSIGLLILTAFIIDRMFKKHRILAAGLMILIIISNLYLIITHNQTKFNQNMIVQEGLVLPIEKEVLDYIYQKSENQPFSVNAVMIPYNVNTTWDYLFNWYGYKKYSRLPVWGGDAAPGYKGKLEVVTSRTNLPKRRFLIIEPSRNIPSYMISGLITEENYFSNVIEEKSFGNITVQVRDAI